MDDTPHIGFRELGLAESTLTMLEARGFEEPTKIQAMTIPLLLTESIDIIGQAQTGTGKTAAFGLPIIERCVPGKGKIQALIMTPTRELAVQVSEALRGFSQGKHLSVVAVYGGQGIGLQLGSLRRGADIVVGTPGRIIDHIDRKTIDLSHIDWLVLDEADEMLDMGFYEDIDKIISASNKTRRTLLFSATMPDRIKHIANRHMNSPRMVQATRETEDEELTEQIYYQVHESSKFEALCRIIDMEDDFYGLVFARTKIDAGTIASRLNERGYEADSLHGDIAQAQREQVLSKFKSRKCRILVATDVAARGIDINDLSHVINFSLPQNSESYIHRIGRTGRAGHEGIAITFVTPQENRYIAQIARVTKASIQKRELPEIDDVIVAKRQRIAERIERAAERDEISHYKEFASELLKKEGQDPERLVSALLRIAFKKALDPSSYVEISKPRREMPHARLYISLGKKDKYNPKTLVGLICGKSGIRPNLIDDVKIFEAYSLITVPLREAESIIKIFRHGKRPLARYARENTGNA
jgi:ATP-dependent RNA helicase DeaD